MSFPDGPSSAPPTQITLENLFCIQPPRLPNHCNCCYDILPKPATYYYVDQYKRNVFWQLCYHCMSHPRIGDSFDGFKHTQGPLLPTVCPRK